MKAKMVQEPIRKDSSDLEEITKWFKDMVTPSITINDSNEISIPTVTSVKVGGSTKLAALLDDHESFKSMKISHQKAILDILFILLKRSVYDVVRFQYFSNLENAPSFTKILFKLLENVYENNEYYLITLRLIRLIGLTATSGLTSNNIRTLFSLLDAPSKLTTAILQTLRISLKQDHTLGNIKASPAYFFNFGGYHAGLYSVIGPPCFYQEYQIVTWFRIERFHHTSSSHQLIQRYNDKYGNTEDSIPMSPLSPSSPTSPSRTEPKLDHTISLVSVVSNEYCIDISIYDKFLTVTVSCQKSEMTKIVLRNYPEDNQGLRRGVWYHLNIKHTKAVFPYISGDDLSIYMDQKLIFQKPVKLPIFLPTSNMTPLSLQEICVGKNFDGQMGPVYFFHEPLPQPVIECISMLDVRKEKNLECNIYNSNPAFPDLIHELTTSDRKTYSINNKISLCYHPARCAYGHVLDIYADKNRPDKRRPVRSERTARHARLGKYTFPSQLIDIRDIIETVGGIEAIITLFPRLLLSGKSEDIPHFIQSSETTTHSDVLAENKSNTSDLLQFDDSPSSSGHKSHPMHNTPMTPYTPLTDVPSSTSILSQSLQNTTITPNNHLNSHQISHPTTNFYTVSTTHHLTQANKLFNTSKLHDKEFGSSLNSLYYDAKQDKILTLHNILDLEVSDYTEDGCLGLLFSIVSLLLNDSRKLQKMCLDNEYIDMIQYVLIRVPEYIYQFENDKSCPLALLKLQESVKFYPKLENLITKRIICNFKIWSKCTFEFQSSLISIIAADVQVRPDHYLSVIGVQEFIDILSMYYMEQTSTYNSMKRRSNHRSSSKQSDVDTMGKTENRQDNRQDSVKKDIISDNDNHNISITLASTSESKSNTNLLLLDLDDSHVTFPSHPVTVSSPLPCICDNSIEDSDIFDTPRYLRSLTARTTTSTSTVHQDSSVVDPYTPRKDDMSPLRMSSFRSPSGKFLRQSSRKLVNLLSHNDDDEGEIGVPLRRSSLIQINETITEDSTLIENNNKTSFKPSTSSKGNTTFSHNTSHLDQTDKNNNDDNNILLTPTTDLNYISKDIPLHTIDDTTTAVKVNSSNPYLSMDKSQKKRLRTGIETIILMLIHKSIQGYQDVKRLLPLLYYCSDGVVADEIVYMILNLIVDGNEKMIITLTESCGGPEEFVTFIIHTLINNELEELRYQGLRLLTFYYMKLDLLPSSITTMSLRNKNTNLLTRTIEKLASSIGEGQVYMQRFLLCGGFTLIHNFLMRFMDKASVLTYAGILEMLLQQPSFPNTLKLQNLYNSNDYALLQSHQDTSSPMTTSRNRDSFTQMNYIYGSGSTSQIYHGPKVKTLLGMKHVDFAHEYIRHYEHRKDNHEIVMIHTMVLPFFCHLLPYFAPVIQHQVLGDLYALLQTSSGNCEALNRPTLWSTIHIIVSKLLDPDESRFDTCKVTTSRIASDLTNWSNTAGTSDTVGKATKSKSQLSSFSPRTPKIRQKLVDSWKTLYSTHHHMYYANTIQQHLDKSLTSNKSVTNILNRSNVSINTPNGTKNDQTDSTVKSHNDTDPSQQWMEPDICFSIGMKTISMLVIHSLSHENGWHDLSKWMVLEHVRTSTSTYPYGSKMDTSNSSSRAIDLLTDTSVTTASMMMPKVLLSHALCDLSILMRSLYNELKSLAKSNNARKKKEATTKIGNIISIVINSSLYALRDESVFSDALPDYKIGVLRCQLSDEHVDNLDELPVIESMVVTKLQSYIVNEEDEFKAKDHPLTSSSTHIQTNIAETGKNIAEDESAAYWLDLHHTWHTLFEDKCLSKSLSKRFLTSPSNASLRSGLSSNKMSRKSLGNTGGRLKITNEFHSTHSMTTATTPTRNVAVFFDDKTYKDGNSVTPSSPYTTAKPLSTSAASFASLKESRKTTASSASKKRRLPHPVAYFGEYLEPLDRKSGQHDAKLLLALQTLQLYDAVYWPPDTLQLRNRHMLKYQLRYTPMNTSTAQRKDNNDTMYDTEYTLPLPVYYHILRTSLYVLQHLSPMNNMATLNIYRIRTLLRPMGSESYLPTNQIPISNLLLATVTHVTIALQRLVYALNFVYTKLGLSPVDIKIKIAGNITEEDKENTYKRQAYEEDFFYQLEQDDVREHEIHQLFDTIPGWHIIKYIKAAFGYYVELIDNTWIKDYLATVLNAQTMILLTSFCERIKNTVSTAFSPIMREPSNETNTSTGTADVSTPHTSASSSPRGRLSLQSNRLLKHKNRNKLVLKNPHNARLSYSRNKDNIDNPSVASSSEDGDDGTCSSVSGPPSPYSRSPMNTTTTTVSSNPFFNTTNNTNTTANTRTQFTSHTTVASMLEKGSSEYLYSPNNTSTTQQLTQQQNSHIVTEDLLDFNYNVSSIDSNEQPYNDRNQIDLLNPSEMNHNKIPQFSTRLEDLVEDTIDNDEEKVEEEEESYAEKSTIYDEDEVDRDNDDGDGQYDEDGDDENDDVSFHSQQSKASSVLEYDNDTSFNSPNPPRNSTVPEISTPLQKDEFKSMNIISVLKLLRDPFILTSNLMRNLDVVRLLYELDVKEKECTRQFIQQETRIQESVGSTLSTTKKYDEESIALQDLCTLVMKNISTQEKTRLTQLKLINQMQSRQIAAKWRNIFRTYDSDRSPWYDQEIDQLNIQIPGIAQYELSRRCDTHLQRMILNRSDVIRDHQNDSYSENLHKVHLDYMHQSGMDQSHGLLPIEHHPSHTNLNTLNSTTSKIQSRMKEAHDPYMFHTFKASWLRDLSQQNPSTDDVDIELDSDSPDKDAMTSATAASNAIAFNTTDDNKLFWMTLFPSYEDEKVLFQDEVIQITLEYRVIGDLILTQRYIYFHPREQVGGHGDNLSVDSIWRDRRWPLDRLNEIYTRRHIFQNCAIELFFIDSTELLVAFHSVARLQLFHNRIRRQNYPLLSSLPTSLAPRVLFSKTIWTELWRKRLITNYEYIMRVNIAAGRSFNDLSQYPVFPWVLSNYISPTLDLHDTKNYRDLSKPLGALDDKRLNEFLERYHNLDCDSSPDSIPPFLYGSHYSTEAFVVYYLIRQEPFTSLAVKLQGGRFDCPDRLFFDIKRTWDGCSSQSLSDVKELVPEFFCCPEIFLNSSQLPLGELQEGGTIHDVILPPWCKNAFDFIRIHREALESDYVSDHLNDWIDLIFGYKQQGEEAKKARNVFHYLTYENAIDIDKIDDYTQKEAIKAQVTHYGQTPSQILTIPHPKRLPKEQCCSPLFTRYDSETLSRFTLITPDKQLSDNGKHGSIIAIHCSTDKLVLMNADFSVCSYKWSSLPDNDKFPFTFKPEKGRVHPSAELGRSRDVLDRQAFIPLVIDKPFSPDLARTYRSKRTREVIYGSWGLESQFDMLAELNTAISDYIDVPNRAHRDSMLVNSRKSSSHHTTSGSSFHDSNLDRKTNASRRALMRLTPRQESNYSRQDSSYTRQDSAYSHYTSQSVPTPTNSLSSVKTMTTNDSLKSMSTVPETIASQTPTANTNDSTKGSGNVFFDFFKKVSKTITTTTGGNTVPPARTVSNNSDPMSPSNPTTYMSDTNMKTLTLEPLIEKSEHRCLYQHRVLLDEVDNAQANAINYNTTTATPLPLFCNRNVAIVAGENGFGRIVTCGFWDNSIRVHSLDLSKEIALNCNNNSSSFTCVQYGSPTSSMFVSGSSDGLCRVWILEKPELANAFNSQSKFESASGQILGQTDENTMLVCAHVLWGHYSPITAISYSSELQLVLSASATGLMCLHSVRNGAFVRSIDKLRGYTIDVIMLASAGYIVAYTVEDKKLHLFWINGAHITSIEVKHRIQCMAVNGSSYVIVCGDFRGNITIRTLWDLELLQTNDHSAYGAISYLGFSSDGQYLLIGSDRGKVTIGMDISYTTLTRSNSTATTTTTTPHP